MKQALINNHPLNFPYFASSQIKTINANRYLNRLCKHFSHKVNVNMENSQGYIDFSIGFCKISIDDELLLFYCGSDCKIDLEDIIDTINRHLSQFSYKESICLQWQYNVES